MKIIQRIRQLALGWPDLTWLAFVVLAVAITWATVNQISQNADLERQTRQLKEEIELLEHQIAVAELEQEFLVTDDYLKLAAADKLGLVNPGASLLILNRDNIKALASKYQQTPEAQIDNPQPTPLEQWIRFFNGQEPL